MNQIQKTALINSLLTASYTVIIGVFMYFVSEVKLGRINTFLAPIAVLLLFVCSAAITGYLMFGKPAQMYIDGKKKEALSLITYTLIFFSAITFTAVILLIFFTR